MSQNPGPPPVSRAVATTGASRAAAENYAVIQETLKADRGAETRAIQAMFGGDKELMHRFLAVAFSALASNSDLLANASPMSIIQSIKDAAAMGLEPTGILGEGAIIRYGQTAQFQPMWRGYMKRIRNSRQVVDLDCQLVFMNDLFDIRLGTTPSIDHVPILVGEKDDEGNPTAERGDYRGAYAWALMPSGKYIIEWMTTDDINYVRDTFSRAKQSGKPGPWDTSWPEMARKTVIRRLAKRLPGEAVDLLIGADARADNAAAALHDATKEAEKSVETLRTVALRAVGQLPAPAATDPPDEAQGQSEGVAAEAGQAAEAEAGAAGPPVDPPPTAVGSDGEGLCGTPSTFGDGQTCVLVKGHEHNHRGPDKSSWN